MTKGLKFDQKKLRWDLVPFSSLEQIVRVLDFGANKYAANNWKRVRPKSRYRAALLRHINLWMQGERFDKETGIHHLAHAGCNIFFLLWFERRKL